ncbi:unnamed protein product [Trichogramma brassicae]|uniref:Uncharacterized protein n=1 Tax=Trichogramma brassicae TaxID=86971 RepID=A0A6H5IXD7_9HYME|nr:unnamed protein product [Trichogramma brassicae]
MAELQEGLKGLQQQSAAAAAAAAAVTVSNVHSQLEKVKLPKFGGDQRDWQGFCDKFTAMVINDKALMPVIKFQHLLNSVSGEPAELLRGIKVESDNFHTAWEARVKLLRLNTHLKTIIQLPTASTESVAHLNQLLSTTNESLNVFKALAPSVANCDSLLVYCVSSKLAPSMQLDWAKDCEAKDVEALTMSRLTSKLPSAPIDIQPWTHMHNLDFADPFYATRSSVDCLLGVDVVAAALRPGLITGPAGTPTALNTVFGWVLMGKGQQRGNDVTQAFSLTVNHELSAALQAFWEVEEISAPKLISPEDTQCYEHFKENVQRDHTGRFIVRLPLVKTPALRNSKNHALGALRRMKRRLENNAELQPNLASNSQNSDRHHLSVVIRSPNRVRAMAMYTESSLAANCLAECDNRDLALIQLAYNQVREFERETRTNTHSARQERVRERQLQVAA